MIHCDAAGDTARELVREPMDLARAAPDLDLCIRDRKFRRGRVRGALRANETVL